MSAYKYFPAAFLLLFISFLSAAQTELRLDINNKRNKNEILVCPLRTETEGISTTKIHSDLLVLGYNWDTLKHRRYDNAIMSNFLRWETNGKVRYTCYMQDTNAYKMRGLGYASGYTSVYDDRLNEMQKIFLLPYKDITTEKQKTIDGHDFIFLDDNHYIALAYYEKAPANIPAWLHPAKGVTVVSSIIQEVKQGRVVWQWDGTEHAELYGNSLYGNDFSDTTRSQDYLHINSMFIDPRDNNLLVSCKNANQVLKLDRTTGAILWKLGGRNSDYDLKEYQQFLKQHHVTVTADHTLLMFDNGDEKLRPQSRILEFRLDEKNKKVLAFKSTDVPGRFTPSAGSVQKIGSKYFLSMGTQRSIMEIDQKTGAKTLEKRIPYASYRVMKY